MLIAVWSPAHTKKNFITIASKLWTKMFQTEVVMVKWAKRVYGILRVNSVLRCVLVRCVFGIEGSNSVKGVWSFWGLKRSIEFYGVIMCLTGLNSLWGLKGLQGVKHL